MRALCARPAERAPHLWGAGRRDAPHAGEEPRQTRGEAPHCPWATGAGGRVCRAPAPCGRGTATGGARMDRAPCARDHTHKGGAAAPPRRIPQMSRSRLWRQGTMSVARMGLAPMPPTRTAVRSVGRRDAAGRPCHGSRRARVHPREDAQSGGRAVANASARGDANEKASAVAQRPPMRIRRGASRRPTDGGCPDRGAPSSRPAGRFPPAGDGPRPAPLYLIQGQNSVKTQ